MPPQKQNTSWGKIFIRVLVSALLIGFFFARVDITKVSLSFSTLSFPIIFLSAGLYLLAFFEASLKWKILLPEYSARALFKFNLIGLFYSTILPGQISGEVVKAYRLSRNSAEAEKIAASVWVDKITGLLGLFLVGIVGVVFTPTFLPQGLSFLVFLSAFLCFFLLFFIRFQWCGNFISKVLQRISTKSIRWQAHASHLLLFISLWREYVAGRRVMFLSVLAGALFQVLAVIIAMVLSHAIGISVSFWDWCWIWGVLATALLLPITIGGLGVRDGVLVGILVWLHASPESALTLSLSLFGVQIFGAAIGGVLEAIPTSRT